MKLWFDSTLAPLFENYIWCKIPFVLKAYINGNWGQINVLDICYGEKASPTVDSTGINILKWLESVDNKATYGKVHWEFNIHNSTPEQIEEMETIITRNNWRYSK